MREKFSRLLLVSLTAGALLLPGGTMNAEQGASRDSEFQKLRHFLSEPLPAHAVSSGAPTFYGPDDLYKYMDGAADIFVVYGVRTLLHQEFVCNEVEITADIFDMGTSDTAFGMYAAERSPKYHFVEIGAEGYTDEGILNFVQDRYYIKLAGFGKGVDAVLEGFAKSISSRIGTNPAFPALLGKLPSEHRNPHSEQYIPNDPLGHSFLGPAFLIEYNVDQHDVKLVVTVAQDGPDAQQRLKRFEEHFTKSGMSSAAPDLGEGAIRAQNSFEGKVIARVKGRYLIVVLGPDAGESIFKSAAQHLE